MNSNTLIPNLTEDEIHPWFDKPALILECVKQVKKDLGNYGIDLTFSGNPHSAYKELFAQLQPQIEVLLNSKSSLLEILYRVDIPESTIRAGSTQQELFSTILTRLILWRELQKVVTKSQYAIDNARPVAQ